MLPALHIVLTAHRVHASTIHLTELYRGCRSFALQRPLDIAWMAECASTQYRGCRLGGGVLCPGPGSQEAARGKRALQQPGRSCVFRGSDHAKLLILAVYGTRPSARMPRSTG